MTRILDRETFLKVVRLTPLVSIDLVVRDPDGFLLLGLRNNRPAKDCWFVPGGRICKDERLDEAFGRIAREELGLALERSSSVPLGSFEHLYDDNFNETPDLSTHYIVLAHRVDLPRRPDLGRDAQHREFRWFDPRAARIDENVHSNTKAYLPLLEGDRTC